MKTNQSALQEAAKIQRQTREALQRTRQQAAETETVGATTLATLREQDERLDQVKAKTDRLNANLDKTKRLQDRFAKLSFQFGTRRKANDLASKDRKEERLLKKMEKKEKQEESSKEQIPVKERGGQLQNWHLDEKIPKSGDGQVLAQEDRKRSEIFGVRKQGKRNQPKLKDNIPAKEAPLSEEDQHFLNQVNAEDDDLDDELDLLSDQLETLFGVAKTLGEEASSKQKKLNAVVDGADKADKKQKVANHRIRLFSMNRKEKRNERALDKKVLLASQVQPQNLL